VCWSAPDETIERPRAGDGKERSDEEPTAREPGCQHWRRKRIRRGGGGRPSLEAGGGTCRRTEATPGRATAAFVPVGYLRSRYRPAGTGAAAGLSMYLTGGPRERGRVAAAVRRWAPGGVHRELAFFRGNRRRLHHAAAGHAIGSGSVESANRVLVTARTRRSGQGRGRDGARGMLTLRALAGVRTPPPSPGRAGSPPEPPRRLEAPRMRQREQAGGAGRARRVIRGRNVRGSKVSHTRIAPCRADLVAIGRGTVIAAAQTNTPVVWVPKCRG